MKITTYKPELQAADFAVAVDALEYYLEYLETSGVRKAQPQLYREGVAAQHRLHSFLKWIRVSEKGDQTVVRRD